MKVGIITGYVDYFAEFGKGPGMTILSGDFSTGMIFVKKFLRWCIFLIGMEVTGSHSREVRKKPCDRYDKDDKECFQTTVCLTPFPFLLTLALPTDNLIARYHTYHECLTNEISMPVDPLDSK